MNENKVILEYGWLVKHIARGYLRAGVDVRDLEQEAYIGLLKAARTWKEKGGMSFKVWAVLKMRSKLAKSQRSVRPSPRDEIDLETICAPVDVGAAVEREEIVSRALQSCRGLPALDRQIVADWACGESRSEIASRVGMSERWVKWRLETTLAELRSAVRQHA